MSKISCLFNCNLLSCNRHTNSLLSTEYLEQKHKTYFTVSSWEQKLHFLSSDSLSGSVLFNDLSYYSTEQPHLQTWVSNFNLSTVNIRPKYFSVTKKNMFCHFCSNYDVFPSQKESHSLLILLIIISSLLFIPPILVTSTVFCIPHKCLTFISLSTSFSIVSFQTHFPSDLDNY